MKYQKYKNMIRNKFFACALLLGLTAVALQAAAPYTIILTIDGPGTISKTSAGPFTSVADTLLASEALTATPSASAVFSHWELLQTSGENVLGYWSGTSTNTTVELYASRVSQGEYYEVIAHFVNAPVDLDVTSDSSAGIPIGDPVPTHGVNAIPLGTVQYAGVRSTYPGNTGVRYNCTGFSGTGDFLLTSPNTNTTATITQASTITWNWDTEFSLTLNTSNGGTSSIDVSPAGRTWYTDGERVILTAQPAAGYNFVRWSGGPVTVDGLTASPVQFFIDQPEEIIAVFEHTHNYL
jgi:hypothetical protein